ncbi:MAG: hypothetical protein IT578_04495 [Verrucomicrobiae bacterium]|nr:hypothetical protein [Verrucomicrobiae bacterium]
MATPALDFLSGAKGLPGAAGQAIAPLTAGTGADMPGSLVAEQEALREKIKTISALTSPGFDNPIIRARFEKFLNASPAEPKAIARYLSLIKEVQEALQRRDDRAAYKGLLEMANFEWDAGIGAALAARVEATRDMKLSNAELEEKVKRMQHEMEAASRNADVMSQPTSITGGGDNAPRSAATGRRIGSTKGPTGSGPSVTADNVPFVEGKMQVIGEYLKAIETRTKIKAAELKTDALELKNKADFQEYIAALFTARRHLHVVIAADFYRCLYGGGDYPSSMANQVNMSKEIVRDVEQAVSVFRYKMEQNEVAGASEQLLNAFVASEFHTALLSLDRESKRRVQTFGMSVAKLQNALEARDFTSVETLLKDIQKQASDFDATKPRSVVEAVKLESRLRLGNARLAAQQGDLKTAMSEFRSAAQTWPGNPDLNSAQLGFFDSQDTKNQLVREFDRLMEEHNFRAIFDKQLPFATAIVGDAKRVAQMKEVLEKVKVIETAIEKAKLFRRNGNPFGAWEALEDAARKWPEDSVLNKLLAELSAESAAFVQQIKRGEEAEQAGSLGFSLACYLNAQRLNPSSDIARAAIERLSERILKKDTVSASGGG